MARRPIIAGNWKMNLDHLEAIQLVQQLDYRLDAGIFDAADVVVIPPFTALRSIQTLIDSDRMQIGLGAQNCHWEESGAYTGEIAPRMLARLNCSYVVCGHSERRQLFGEGDAIVNRKAKAILTAGMTPIVCVGETQAQRDAGETDEVLAIQVSASLDGLSAEQVTELVVAYEPVWAIGSGRTALPEDADGGCAAVRDTIRDVWGDPVADAVRVQYGGSVKAGNAAQLLAQPEVDGALVGGASLEADDFAAICRAVLQRPG